MGERRRHSPAPPVPARCSDCGLRHHHFTPLNAASTKAASPPAPRGIPLTHCACTRPAAGFRLARDSVTPERSRKTSQPTAWRTAEPAALLNGAACGAAAAAAADCTHLTQAIQLHSAAATQREARHSGHTRCKHFESKPFAAVAIAAVTARADAQALARNVPLQPSVVLHFAVTTSRPGVGKTVCINSKQSAPPWRVGGKWR